MLADNSQAVADWQAGKGKAMGFLMGQAMGRLKGKADPAQVKMQLESALGQIGGQP